MTGHFTTLDGCERWVQLVGTATEYYRMPFTYRVPRIESIPFTTPCISYDFRTYKLESLDYARGLAEYVEVYSA